MVPNKNTYCEFSHHYLGESDDLGFISVNGCKFCNYTKNINIILNKRQPPLRDIGNH